MHQQCVPATAKSVTNKQTKHRFHSIPFHSVPCFFKANTSSQHHPNPFVEYSNSTIVFCIYKTDIVVNEITTWTLLKRRKQICRLSSNVNEIERIQKIKIAKTKTKKQKTKTNTSEKTVYIHNLCVSMWKYFIKCPLNGCNAVRSISLFQFYWWTSTHQKRIRCLHLHSLFM